MNYKDIINESVALLNSDALSINENLFVKNLFTSYLEKYWNEQFEPNFKTIELQDLWFYTKIRFLSKMVGLGYKDAYDLLSAEMRTNATKYKSHSYSVKRIDYELHKTR